MLAAEANGRTRLVINVDTLMPYVTKVDGNTITVTLGNQPGAALAAASSKPPGDLDGTCFDLGFPGAPKCKR